jgi:tetratricopeptide (TPR) repeat protein
MDLGADPLGQGKALEAQGRIPEAVDAYLEALRQEPGDLLAWKALAAAYGRQGGPGAGPALLAAGAALFPRRRRRPGGFARLGAPALAAFAAIRHLTLFAFLFILYPLQAPRRRGALVFMLPRLAR